MSTRTHDRLDEIRERIGRLDAKAQAGRRPREAVQVPGALAGGLEALDAPDTEGSVRDWSCVSCRQSPMATRIATYDLRPS